ncbi:hypothetical protein [Pseudarthrobacter sp. N5]|uniref:hypothetical protein n=1 Tax=Pseudarthrobacter sp. N5 TaxID=3418416 RepID=UPI003CF62101
MIAIAALVSMMHALPAAADDDAGLWLEPGPYGAPALLTPGSTSRWDLGVTTSRISLGALTVQLSATGPLAELAASPEAVPLT